MKRKLFLMMYSSLTAEHLPFYNCKFTGLGQNPYTAFGNQRRKKWPQGSRNKHGNKIGRKKKRHNQKNRRKR